VLAHPGVVIACDFRVVCVKSSSIYCRSCVYPNIAANPLIIDEGGMCTGCRVSEAKQTIDWTRRWQEFEELCDEYRDTPGNYDCVIPVGGGKDSYYQTHLVVKRMGLRALLVTYHGNNYLPEGEENLQSMRDVFGCDHVIFRPSTDMLVRLNRLAFRLHGDMNWHNHCGIETYPVRMAVQHGVSLIFWGEHGGVDLGGMYSLNDYIEYTAKYRLEHALHGLDCYNFTDQGLEELGRPELKEGLGPRDFLWGQYPSDDEIDQHDVRGVYIGNYVRWEANEHAKLMMDLYRWQSARRPFERTYRMVSNLDDMHENGVHDYLKFVKFGYGRATDHACKDIRSGVMSREEGVEMVRRYDHVKPRRDLNRWLEYVGMEEEEFDYVCDGFRDPRVWWIENNEWWKQNVWGEPSSYGRVSLRTEEERSKYLM